MEKSNGEYLQINTNIHNNGGFTETKDQKSLETLQNPNKSNYIFHNSL